MVGVILHLAGFLAVICCALQPAWGLALLRIAVAAYAFGIGPGT